MKQSVEEMAEEYANTQNCLDDRTSRRYAFLAGYKAAKDQQFPGAKPDKVLIDEPELVADVSKVMPQWISVKDRLPQLEYGFAMRRESECVLIASDGNVHVAHLCEKWCDRTQLIFEACDCDCRGHDMEQDEWELDDVTHWMPLPAPPKEEE